MDGQSFRDILAQFLEEESEISPRQTVTAEPQTPSFHWQNPKPHQAAKATYPPPPKRKMAPPPTPAPVKARPPEPKWKIQELSHADQQHIKTLVQLGANEINGEISLSNLKKAHRRLARALHPDTAGPKQKEQFLLLQSIYERLSRSLQARASESACGNGSASAAESRRQDAA